MNVECVYTVRIYIKDSDSAAPAPAHSTRVYTRTQDTGHRPAAPRVRAPASSRFFLFDQKVANFNFNFNLCFHIF